VFEDRLLRSIFGPRKESGENCITRSFVIVVGDAMGEACNTNCVGKAKGKETTRKTEMWVGRSH
jgi:hypothetical protein